MSVVITNLNAQKVKEQYEEKKFTHVMNNKTGDEAFVDKEF